MESLREHIEELRRKTEKNADDIQQLKEDRVETKIMMRMITESLAELKTMIKEVRKDTGEGDRWKTVMIEAIKAIGTIAAAVFAVKQF